MRLCFPASTFFFLVIAFQAAYADAVVLHSGEVLFGTLVEAADQIQIQNRGSSVLVNRAGIRRIYRQNEDEVEFRTKILEITEQGNRNLRNMAAREDSQGRSLSERWQVIMRSALVPGWGQIYAGESQRGWVFLATTALAGGYFLNAHLNYLAADQRYKSDYQNTMLMAISSKSAIAESFQSDQAFFMSHLISRKLFLDSYSARQAAGQTRLQASVVFGALYAANLLDASFFTPVSENAAYHIQAGSSPDQVSVRLSVPF